MRLVFDASTFVAEVLRARGRRLLARPDLDLLVAAKAMSETEHELRRRVALLVQRRHLEPAPAAQLFEEALATIAGKVKVIPHEVYAARLGEAQQRVPRDPRDAPTVAPCSDPGLRHLDGRLRFLWLWRVCLDNGDAAAARTTIGGRWIDQGTE